METYEKLGAFYLGKRYDEQAEKIREDELLLYDAKDLTTHAICVGMTGSGKTGLCISLLEEAAIDGIPAIAIDPKGDLGNLMLTFPKLRAEDFRPWIDPAEANRKGMTVDGYAADRARLWSKGLGDWQQDGSRIKRFKDAAEVSIYTPGSSAGLPITVLRSFAAPPPSLLADPEAFRDRIMSAVSGVLALLGLDTDPIRSREHILLSNILDRAWQQGRDMDIASLIQEIQNPPFGQIGVMDLEQFFPSRERFGLAMTLNNLLASPGFAAWMEGEPLDISRLLYTAEGRPRISILSIAHLSESERMFFVTILLNEVVSWMRTQPGTSSLRALLYMDEIFGFFPPTANPPSKRPMLTLLKQARAYGLGVVLATQNPVDLDYKGLSNTGTWFLGRLQTERDKMRVLEGLEGASVAAGSSFDRAKMEQTLAGLGSRVFLMNNVHDNEPAIFHTRWALSYLRGPMTRSQISTLMADQKATTPAPPPPPAAPAWTPAAAPPAASVVGNYSGMGAGMVAGAVTNPVAAAAAAAAAQNQTPPSLDSKIKQRFLPITGNVPAGARVVYRPGLVGLGRMHFVRVSAKVDYWDNTCLYTLFDGPAQDDPWEEAEALESPPTLASRPDGTGEFTRLPPAATKATNYKQWSKAFVDHLYRNRSAIVLKCAELKQYSEPNESERDFRIRLKQDVHEKRDLAIEKLRKRYEPKLVTLKDRIRRAEDKIEREEAQFKQQSFQTAISLGSTVLGALFGRKAASVGTVGRAASTVKGAGRAAREKGDIGRAEEAMEATSQKLQDLEAEFKEEVDKVTEMADVDRLEFDEIIVRPRKGDMSVKEMSLVWAPYRVDPSGLSEPLYAFPS